MKRTLFWTFLFLVPLLLVAALEGGLRLFHYGNTYPLVVKKTIAGREFYAINRAVAHRYFSQPGSVVPEPHEDLFAVRKSPTTKRVFCIGESTMEGFPYEFSATAPGFLKDRLRTLLPRYDIEVINVGLSAVGTFVVRDLMRELLHYQPDLFILYAGHNEFYGAYGVGSTVAMRGGPWLTRLTFSLVQFRTYQLVRNAFNAIRGSLATGAADGQETLMEQMVGREEIPFGSDLYRAGRSTYTDNIELMIQDARHAGVPLLVSTLVSNIHTQPPFRSVRRGDLTDVQRAAWDSLMTTGEQGHAALASFRAATVVDSGDALGYFKLGNALLRSGSYDEARAALSTAKDLDALRFRMSEQFQEDLLSLCVRHGVPVARVDSAFIAESPHGIIGSELILEHLHPNIAGYFLMARTWCRSIASHGLLLPDSSWEWSRDRTDSAYLALSTVSAFDTLLGSIKVDLLTHKPPFTSTAERYTFVPRNDVERLVYTYVQGKIAWSNARYQLGEYYAGRRDYARARRECRAIAKVIPFSYQPLLRVADYYGLEGKTPEAIEAYRASIRTEDNPFARIKLAYVLLQLERTADAIAQLDSAFRPAGQVSGAVPADAATVGRYLLGVAYAKSGRIGDARIELQRALAIDPNNHDARELLRTLSPPEK